MTASEKKYLAIGIVICALILFWVIGTLFFEKTLHIMMAIPLFILFIWIAMGVGPVNMPGPITKTNFFALSSGTREKKPVGERRPRLSGGDKHGREDGNE